MHYYEVAPNQIIRSDSEAFTYSSTEKLTTGHIVEIEVGKRKCIGVVLGAVNQPTFTTKPIVRLIDPQPLPTPLVATARWISSYYASPLATVLQVILPKGMDKIRRPRQALHYSPVRKRTQILLNKEQSLAISKITSMKTGSILLHGVTGSGKTQVYIELIKNVLRQGKSAMVLVPEIALTPQLVDEFSHYFQNIALTHSRQPEAERHLTWKAVLNSSVPQVIIGPRSALFLPVTSLGLIVIDEAHEPSFKQEKSPRYSALRAASILAKYHKAKVIYGSATPAISEYFLAQQNQHPIIMLSKQARPNTIRPTIELVDMTKQYNFKKHRFLSDKLLESMTTALDSKKQVLIFHNRRGSANMTLCENCGWTALCPHCFIPFTLHIDRHILQCHICNLTQKIPTHCPSCNMVDIIFKGIGTKLIELELQKIFPNKKIVRFDADSEKKTGVDHYYKDLYKGSIDIIIGTRVIAKGLDLPHLRVVGVVQADTGLVLPDFSSSERAFQLLAQVTGRVGRSHHPTTVIVQSYQPNHPAVVAGLSQNYQLFYDTAIKERKAGNFPPFSYLLKLTCLYKTEAAAIKNAQKLATQLRNIAPSYVQILGPTPAFYEHQGGNYRWQLVLKSPKRAALQQLLSHLPSNHWQFELDPTSLL